MLLAAFSVVNAIPLVPFNFKFPTIALPVCAAAIALYSFNFSVIVTVLSVTELSKLISLKVVLSLVSGFNWVHVNEPELSLHTAKIFFSGT